jgi:hypothetical protein
LVQQERVTARREMARRFSRELKESIFPLHMAAEDLVQAREETSERFDEIFFECTTNIRAELDRLKQIAVRFGEFARMPRPQPGPLDVNEAARAALKAVEPQLCAAGRTPVTPDVHLSEPEPFIEADPDHLRVALENLLLHCLDAMPSGGTLAVRTREADATVRIEITAKGATLSKEDCQRLFVPGGSTPDGMTGLGLATAHAIVNDHGGRISAELVTNREVIIRMEFPAARAVVTPQASPATERQGAQITAMAATSAMQQLSSRTEAQAPLKQASETQVEVAQNLPIEIAGQERAEAAPEPAAVQTETAEAAESVPVMVAVSEATVASEETEHAAGTADPPHQQTAAPAPAAVTRSRDWLNLDRNSLRL